MKTVASILLAILAPVVANSVWGQSYSIIDIGQGSAYGMNNSGQVVGMDNSAQSFLYSNGVLTEIPAPVSNVTPDQGTVISLTFAFGINNAGKVTGQFYQLTLPNNGASSIVQDAFLYANGSTTDLGNLGGATSNGWSINDRGEISGSSDLPNGDKHASIFAHGTITDLGTLGGTTSSGGGINLHDQVVGDSATSNGDTHAFLYSDRLMEDIGTLGGHYSTASSINDHGQITGGFTLLGEAVQDAFLYSHGKMRDLGNLGGGYGLGEAINATGEIVGSSTTTSGDYHAFLYSHGHMVDLNTLTTGTLATYVTLSGATAINDRGWIAADGIDSRTGQGHAYLLKLVNDCRVDHGGIK